MKIYQGTSVVHEEIIKDRPVGIQTLMDTENRPAQMMIAVASGSKVYYFKDYAPHMMFELPLIEFSEEETSLWQELLKLCRYNNGNQEDATESSQELDIPQTMSQVVEKLYELREEK